MVREAGMAQKITVILEDDLDGGPADETVRFALDGAAYEIDLSTKHAKALRRKLEPFISHARKAGRGPRRRTGPSAASRERSDGIRAWAKAHASRLATAGASPPASLSNTRPPAKTPDPGWYAAESSQLHPRSASEAPTARDGIRSLPQDR